MFRHQKRRDANHAELTDLAERLGATVLDLSQLGDDAPDALIGFQGVDRMVEFKMPGEYLKPGQARFRRQWRGHRIDLVRTGDDLTALLLGSSYETPGTRARMAQIEKPPRKAKR